MQSGVIKVKKTNECTGLTASSVQINAEYNLFSAVRYAVISILFTFGFIITAAKISGTECTLWVTAVTAVLLSFAVFFIRLAKKIRSLYFLFPVIFIIFLFLFFKEDINKGFIGVYNGFVKGISCSDGIILFKLYAENISVRNITLFFEVVCSAVCLIISVCIISGDVFVPLFMLFCVTVFGIHTENTSAFGIVLMMSASLSLTLKSLKAKKSESENKASLSVRLVIISLLLLTLSVSVYFFNTSKNNLSLQIKENTFKKTDTFRYGEDNALPCGDFSKINRISSDKKEMLRVVMSKPQSYYLRGFVGGDYSVKGWKSPEYKKLYDYSDMFYVLHQNNFYGHSQISLLCSNLYSISGDNRIIVKNIGACRKYIYAPYETDTQKSFLSYNNRLDDCGILSDGFFGEKNYIYFAYDNKVKNYSSLENALYTENYENKYSDYLKSEAHYRNFVYKNYLDIPEAAENVIKSVLGSYEKSERISYTAAKLNILNVLSKNEYSDEVNYKCTGNTDIVSEFLQETKIGNSVHFASAAALMLRYYGIPSRYAEGYAITPDDTENVRSNTEIIITDDNAHMWAEYYCDGIGWLPFETVPKYIGIMQDEINTDFKTSVSSSEKSVSSSEKSKSDSTKTDDTENSYSQPDNRTDTLFYVVCGIISAALIISALSIIFILNRRRKALFKQLRNFQNKDNNIAAVSLFKYSTDLLEITGCIESSDNIYLAESHSVKKLTEYYGDTYTKAYAVFLKARFSRHKISDDEKICVEIFKNETVTSIKNSRSRLQRFSDKYISFLYI